MGRRLKVNMPLVSLAALLLGCALIAGFNSAARADGTGTASAMSPGQVCTIVIVKVRARHWVWLKETRKIHGHRVFVRRHGKVVLVHVRVSYLRAEPTQVCTVTPLAALTPPSPVTPSAPASSPPAEVLTSPQRPLNSEPPSIGGSTRAGQMLTAEPGAWSGSPTSYTYQWQRCDSAGASCSAINAATSSTYLLGAADVEATLRVTVIASNAGGDSAPATSPQSAVVNGPPINSSLPSVGGVSASGQTLTATPGAWSGSPTSYTYQWQRCDSAGASCSPVSGATAQAYILGSPDVGSTLRVAVTAFNASGASVPATGVQTTVVTAQPRPQNTSPPTITGTVQQGQTLTEVHGEWTNSPTSYTYQWLQCNGSGANCAAISGATNQAYVLLTSDVGHTIRVEEAASNAGGASAPASSSATGVVPTPVPTSTKPPSITGKAQQGQTLTEVHGEWTNSPTSYAYRWLQCSSSGVSCLPISGATSQTYVPVAGDVGQTIRVEETASNAAGPSTPASSSVTSAVVPPVPVNAAPPTINGTAQQGKTLTEVHGTWTNEPTSYVYQWLQCESSGNGCLPILGASAQTYAPVAGDVGHAIRVQETASNAGGSGIAASSAPTADVIAAAPANSSPPSITGTAQQGQTLTAHNGSWTNEPTSFGYQWQRCDPPGANCVPVSGATAQTYPLGVPDVGSTLRVSVTATNGGGASKPAVSGQSSVVAAASGVSHLEYVVQDGATPISVYDMDHEFKLLKTISLPQAATEEIRGVSVAPSTHLMFIMFGGDGPINGSGNGSVLAYDLVAEKVVWEVKLSTGIDSGQVSPDGKKLYVPTGENTNSGIWNILSTENGAVTGTIKGGAGAHNTVVSNDGAYVYMAGRSYNFLDVYETATQKVKEIGPLIGTVRPFTVNGSNTLAFTTATGFDGFQVSSVTTGKVLFTTSFGEVPEGFPLIAAPSHGASLSPDEKELFVIDAVHKEVQVWNVSKVNEGIAPTQIGVIPVAGLTGNETPCFYDCMRGGWLQRSTDGRLLFVGDSGEVIDTATRKVLTTLSTLAQTKKSIEVDWQAGVPIATSGRTGVGGVG
jgi:hypothetical protein